MSSPKGAAINWAELPSDLLSQIFVRLEIVDSIRSSSVCRPWNQASKGCKPKPSKLPWLMMSLNDKSDSCHFYSLAEQRTYKMHLPQISGRHIVGSSDGFIVSIDRERESQLYITNPLTGTHHALPSAETLPAVHEIVRDPYTGLESYCHHRNGIYPACLSFHKAVVIHSNNTTNVFVIYGEWGDIAYARPRDTAWKTLSNRVPFLQDIVFHKGQLHAIDFQGTVIVYNHIGHSDIEPSFTSPVGPLATVRHCYDICYLVESPDGKDLYMISKTMRAHPLFEVFILNKTNYTWTPIGDVGDATFFLGYNRSLALSVKEFPELKRNCIYITKDSVLISQKLTEVSGMEIFELGDKSKHSLVPFKVDHECLNWPQGIWFIPLLP